MQHHCQRVQTGTDMKSKGWKPFAALKQWLYVKVYGAKDAAYAKLNLDNLDLWKRLADSDLKEMQIRQRWESLNADNIKREHAEADAKMQAYEVCVPLDIKELYSYFEPK